MWIHALITLFFLILFGLLILRGRFWEDELIPRKAFLGVFLLKFIAGFLLWAVYSYYYPLEGTSDAFNYYNEAEILHEALYEDPLAYSDLLLGTDLDPEGKQRYLDRIYHWVKPYNYGVMNDNRTIIRANMLCRLVSFGYYHVHTAIFCFMSFLGLTALYRSFVRFLPELRWACFAAAFLLPSVLFWGSGVLKEGILLFALGFFIFYWVRFLEDRSWRSLPLALLFTLLLVSVKTYVLLALIPGLLCYSVYKSFRIHSPFAVFSVGHLLILLAGFNLPKLGIPYKIPYMIQLKQKDFYNVAAQHDAGSTVDAPAVEGKMDLIMGLPHAWWNALFRPHLLEMKSWLYVAPAFENLFLLLLLVGVFFFAKWPSCSLRAFFYWGLSFILILGALIGFTTPVLGAVIRYQIPLLPFYIFVLLCVVDWRKLKGRFTN